MNAFVAWSSVVLEMVPLEEVVRRVTGRRVRRVCALTLIMLKNVRDSANRNAPARFVEDIFALCVRAESGERVSIRLMNGMG
jgi:hypothetical protein